MIDLSSLNESQLAAVTAPDGPTLIIAGAGSGKTRTLVHRLAWLTEQGTSPEDILLLTFTRKAAREMLTRAQDLVGSDLGPVKGGTFHGFAFSVLRRFRPAWADGPTTVMDQGDAVTAITQCRTDLGIAKGDRSFPKSQSILAMLSKARNKEKDMTDLLLHDAPHLADHRDDFARIYAAYTEYKRTYRLLDYDDLLFELEALLAAEDGRPPLPFRHILVDEYQDTNKVQARLVRLLAGPDASVMAVGDDAQSIYAFRGADVRNILDFPRSFPGTRIIRLEENYRSTRPILDVANAVLADAAEGYAKTLFTRREGGEAVRILHPQSDLTQARLIARRIDALLGSHAPSEIAVLFRAGFQSYHLEVELARLKIAFRKFGGQKYAEAKHVKNVLSFVRLLINPLDLPSFLQMASLCPGIGPKTAQKIYEAVASGNGTLPGSYASRYKDLDEYVAFLERLRSRPSTPSDTLARIVAEYRPALEREFPDDYPKRLQGLEELGRIAADYDDLNTFVADLALGNPDEDDGPDEDAVVLSTIHSAKGLEWDAVIILDLVEDRFPSHRATGDPEEFEEERRLMYVACTRARRSLELSVPRTIYDRQGQGNIPVAPSPFVKAIPFGRCEEWMEGYGGQLTLRTAPSRVPSDGYPTARPRPATISARAALTVTPPASGRDVLPRRKAPTNGLGFCRHRIFGRGKIVERIPPDKVRVSFPGLGLKVILSDFITMEDEHAD